MSWQDRAACKGRPTEPFFQAKVPRWVRALCAGCPVRANCLMASIEQKDFDGFRGGLSAPERLRMAERAPYRVNRRRAS